MNQAQVTCALVIGAVFVVSFVGAILLDARDRESLLHRLRSLFRK